VEQTSIRTIGGVVLQMAAYHNLLHGLETLRGEGPRFFWPGMAPAHAGAIEALQNWDSMRGRKAEAGGSAITGLIHSV